MAGVNYEKYYEQRRETYQIQERVDKFIVRKFNTSN